MDFGNLKYKETLEFLYSQLPAFERDGSAAYKPGLERVSALEAAFGNPHDGFASIHIAGTNGKGSTAHTLAAVLQSAGYATGLFTSPHLVDFRERIRVNGEMITEDEVVEFVERYNSMNLSLHPSFFELTTTMAFDFFRKRKVDIAVVETGLGGRLDSTNIITPVLSVITNISLDHTSFLGNTRAEIAGEKAGIIKPRVPVVIGEKDTETYPVFAGKASETGSKIIFADDAVALSCSFGYDGAPVYHTDVFGDVKGELRGDYQRKNAATVFCAVEELKRKGYEISADNVRTGFSNVCELTGLMGRWMKINDRPLTICDTGHNTGGWTWLVPQIERMPGKKNMVIGFVDDKDVKGILEMIRTGISNYRLFFTQPDNHRALASEELKRIASEYGMEGDAFATVAEAYEKALASAGKGDSVYVGGSSYVVADFLSGLRKKG